MYKIAILLTCYNRVHKTVECLTRLFSQEIPLEYHINVFLVDDASPDHTGTIVSSKFSSVHVIQGTGNLYWCGGMRLAWETAMANSDYDFYLWLNDDTMLFPHAIQSLLADFLKLQTAGRDGVLSACCCDVTTGRVSYGGVTSSGFVIPNGEPQPCRTINGNLVLVPRSVFASIGGISKEFTHGIGDFDYGLRAAEAGFSCWVTGNFLANCSRNTETMRWCSPETPLRERIWLLYSPKGPNLREFLIYKRRHYGWLWMGSWAKAWGRVLFPALAGRIWNGKNGSESQNVIP